MAEMGGPVDRAYLVSVEGLRNICDALADGWREYKVTCEDEKKVVLVYSDGRDDLNAVCFTFPIVADIWLLGGLLRRRPEAGLMVCLHIYTGKQTRHGIYLEDGDLWRDSIGDWEKFWGPLEAALVNGMKCRLL